MVDRVDLLARRIARRAGEPDLEEAASVGLAALAEALRRYDRPRRAALPTYCHLVVSCRVMDWVRSERRRRKTEQAVLSQTYHGDRHRVEDGRITDKHILEVVRLAKALKSPSGNFYDGRYLWILEEAENMAIEAFKDFVDQIIKEPSKRGIRVKWTWARAEAYAHRERRQRRQRERVKRYAERLRIRCFETTGSGF
jgi:DNA-directed RNA polymerase specialized sigma24 family protein